ncbi:MAG: 2-dehydropantoate 2-reductase [Chthoniobacterales bacterium]
MMRIAVIGAGAVGSYFGGRLAQAGNDVSFVARGKHLEALRQRPLRVESINGDFEVKVSATDSPEDIGHVDVVFVAVKGWQVPEAAALIPPLIDRRSVVIPLQNGVEAPAQLIHVLGRERVVGGFCKIIAFVTGPGHVRHLGADPFIAFGELTPPSASERLEKIRDEFMRAGVTCEIPADITGAMWEKFIFIASISGVGAVTRLPIGQIRSGKETRAELDHAIREMAAVAAALNVTLPHDIVARTFGYIDGLPADGTASMQRDIMEGRPSELESQTGAVVRLGRSAGVATPTHDAIYRALAPLERRVRDRF